MVQGLYERRIVPLEDLLSFLLTLLVGQTSDGRRGDVLHHREALFGSSGVQRPASAETKGEAAKGRPLARGQGPPPGSPGAVQAPKREPEVEGVEREESEIWRQGRGQRSEAQGVGAGPAGESPSEHEEEVSGITAATGLGPGGESGEEVDTGAKQSRGGGGLDQEEEPWQGDEEGQGLEEIEGQEGDWAGGEEEWGEEGGGELLGAVCSALASLGEGDSVLRILVAPICDALVSAPSSHSSLLECSSLGASLGHGCNWKARPRP